jgi:hypothetical protein
MSLMVASDVGVDETDVDAVVTVSVGIDDVDGEVGLWPLGLRAFAPSTTGAGGLDESKLKRRGSILVVDDR